MTIQIGGFKTLAGGRRFYAYSGIKIGDVTDPPDIELIEIKSTGLRDAFVKFFFYFGEPVDSDAALGGQIFIDDVEIFNQQNYRPLDGGEIANTIELFVPRQSKLTVKSLNTAVNNLQKRGANILGWYL